MEENEEDVFGRVAWAPEEKAAVQRLLETKIGLDKASFRPGPAGSMSRKNFSSKVVRLKKGEDEVKGQRVKRKTLVYCATPTMIEEVNNIFGPDGWSSSVTNMTQDFLEEEEGKFSCACSAVVKITLKNGTNHEDVGYGYARRQPSIQKAIETAKKTAVSDGLKRALRQFGHALGNCMAMQSYQSQMLSARKQQQSYYSQPKKPTTTSVTVGITKPQQPQQLQLQQTPTTTSPPSAPSPLASRPVPKFQPLQRNLPPKLNIPPQPQQLQQPKPLQEQPQQDYFPEEEYAQEFPADDDMSDFYQNQPKINNGINAGFTNANADPNVDPNITMDPNAEMYEFQDGENLSQPHPDEVPLDDQQQQDFVNPTEGEVETVEDFAATGNSFAQSFKRKATSQPSSTTTSSNFELPSRSAWSQPTNTTNITRPAVGLNFPNKSQRTFTLSSPNART